MFFQKYGMPFYWYEKSPGVESAELVLMLNCPNSEKVFLSHNSSCFNLAICPLYFKLKPMDVIYPHSWEAYFKYV